MMNDDQSHTEQKNEYLVWLPSNFYVLHKSFFQKMGEKNREREKGGGANVRKRQKQTRKVRYSELVRWLYLSNLPTPILSSRPFYYNSLHSRNFCVGGPFWVWFLRALRLPHPKVRDRQTNQLSLKSCLNKMLTHRSNQVLFPKSVPSCNGISSS